MGLVAKTFSFVRSYLSPADRLAETLCGLIMVLSFTLVAAPQVREGREGVQSLLLATLGCNVAWGVIDGVLYILFTMSQRARRARIGRQVRKAPDEAGALAAVRAELEPDLQGLASPADRDALYRAVVPMVAQIPPGRTRATRDDLLGGVAILILEVVCTLPAAVPFLFMESPMAALRVSNALLLGLLFVVGYLWGKEIESNRFLAGLAMFCLGLALVGVAMALGG